MTWILGIFLLSILQRLPAVFFFCFKCKRITVSIQRRLPIPKTNKAAYRPWTEIAMTIKKVSRETISRLYCISIRLKWNSQRGPSNVKIVARDYPRSKKRMHWLMIAKILLHIEKNPSKEKHRQQVLLIQKTAQGVWRGRHTQSHETLQFLR